MLSKDDFISQYLERIGYRGSRTPCLETLVSLQRQHVYSIPFENLDILAQLPPNLDRDYLFDKLVTRRRGGVCYELNTSFYNLLTALGFSADQISGRSYLDSPMTGHVFTLVHLPEGDYLADVGYGENAIPPLNVKSGQVVEAYHAAYWVKWEEDGLPRVYRQIEGQEAAFQYQFSLTVRHPEDYMDTFRFTAAPGNTFFSERHICCRFTPEGRIVLRRGTLAVIENNQVASSHPVPLGEATDRCLREYFDLP